MPTTHTDVKLHHDELLEHVLGPWLRIADTSANSWKSRSSIIHSMSPRKNTER